MKLQRRNKIILCMIPPECIYYFLISMCTMIKRLNTEQNVVIKGQKAKLRGFFWSFFIAES